MDHRPAPSPTPSVIAPFPWREKGDRQIIARTHSNPIILFHLVAKIRASSMMHRAVQ